MFTKRDSFIKINKFNKRYDSTAILEKAKLNIAKTTNYQLQKSQTDAVKITSGDNPMYHSMGDPLYQNKSFPELFPRG